MISRVRQCQPVPPAGGVRSGRGVRFAAKRSALTIGQVIGGKVAGGLRARTDLAAKAIDKALTDFPRETLSAFERMLAVTLENLAHGGVPSMQKGVEPSGTGDGEGRAGSGVADGQVQAASTSTTSLSSSAVMVTLSSAVIAMPSRAFASTSPIPDPAGRRHEVEPAFSAERGA